MTFSSPNGTPLRKYLSLTSLVPYLTKIAA